MSFGSELAAFEAKTEEKMLEAVRRISLLTFSECIKISPVDTGRFLGNWQTSVGQIPSGTVEVLDPSGNIATARVAGAVDGMEPGDVIYMANNLPYAQRLEEGHSKKQAPFGMVKLTVQRFQPIANQIIAELSAR